MKNIKINTFLIAFIVTTSFLIGCQDTKTKAEIAEENLIEAQLNLSNLKESSLKDAQKMATEAEYKIFKAETEVKVQANKVRIAQLRVNKNTADLERVNDLEARNSELDERLIAYESYKTDWQKFKEEFNSDMNELGVAFQNFTEDKK
jgi:hypothetical protein